MGALGWKPPNATPARQKGSADLRADPVCSGGGVGPSLVLLCGRRQQPRGDQNRNDLCDDGANPSPRETTREPPAPRPTDGARNGPDACESQSPNRYGFVGTPAPCKKRRGQTGHRSRTPLNLNGLDRPSPQPESTLLTTAHAPRHGVPRATGTSDKIVHPRGCSARRIRAAADRSLSAYRSFTSRG